MTMTPGAYIRMKRKNLNLTIDQIAQLLGVNNSTVSRWESGDIDNMRRDKIAKLAEILHISPLELLDITPNTEVTIKKEPSPLTAREFMRIICKGDKESLAIVERLQLTDDGRLQITGADLASQAVLDHQVKGLISALKNAKLADDGLLHFNFTPDRKE